jgi:hypothetical protein
MTRWLAVLVPCCFLACKTSKEAAPSTPRPAVAAAPAPAPADAARLGPPGDGGAVSGPDNDYLPGRPDLKICKKEWTPEQCCAFLCSCLGQLCADSPRSQPGLATCMDWCPKLADKARRCHVYHCYVSVSPTGGIKDHDSHCRHASDQLPGGGCPAAVFQ